MQDTRSKFLGSAVIRLIFAKPIEFLSQHFINGVENLKKKIMDSEFAPLIIDNKSSLTSATIIQLTIGFSNTPMQITIDMPEDHLVSFIQEMGYAAATIR